MKKHYKELPTEIKVGQRAWKVVVRNEGEDAQLSRAWAYTYSTEELIVLQSRLTAGRLRSTLLHEVLHAIRMTFHNSEASVEDKGEDESYRDYEERWEHYFINLYQDHLLMVLRDNPKLTAFLLMDEDR